MRRVTLKDIAEITRFSVNTVSRALNGRPEIKETTRSQILDVAEKLGYRPNRLAQGLRNQRTGIIGVVVTDISNPFFGAVVKSIEKESRKKGYQIILLDTDENPDLEHDAIQTLISQHVDGAIICPTQHNDKYLRELEHHGVKLVLLARRFLDADFSYVIPNDEQAGYLAADHLIRLGHRRIAFINAPRHISSAQDRLSGFAQAHRDHGLALSESLVRFGALCVSDGYEIAKQLLTDSLEITAVITFSDFVALGVIRAARDVGLRVPDNLSVVGIDDSEFSSAFPLSLTTVRSPTKELGQSAMHAIVRQLGTPAGEKPTQTCEIIDMELMVRTTTASPPRKA
jgi:LacI family transcriptional regulator